MYWDKLTKDGFGKDVWAHFLLSLYGRSLLIFLCIEFFFDNPHINLKIFEPSINILFTTVTLALFKLDAYRLTILGGRLIKQNIWKVILIWTSENIAFPRFKHFLGLICRPKILFFTFTNWESLLCNLLCSAINRLLDDIDSKILLNIVKTSQRWLFHLSLWLLSQYMEEMYSRYVTELA